MKNARKHGGVCVRGTRVAPRQCGQAVGSSAGCAIEAHATRLEGTIAGFPPALQTEVTQLATLLSHPPGRVALMGLWAAWETADPSDVRAALQRQRVSSLALCQQVYHALRDLSNAAYFADPLAWATLAYPGPRTI